MASSEAHKSIQDLTLSSETCLMEVIVWLIQCMQFNLYANEVLEMPCESSFRLIRIIEILLLSEEDNSSHFRSLITYKEIQKLGSVVYEQGICSLRPSTIVKEKLRELTFPSLNRSQSYFPSLVLIYIKRFYWYSTRKELTRT